MCLLKKKIIIFLQNKPTHISPPLSHPLQDCQGDAVFTVGGTDEPANLRVTFKCFQVST